MPDIFLVLDCIPHGFPKFFDVITYTGDGSGSVRNINHNLGSVPGMIIVKNTNAGNWAVWHRTFATDTNMYLDLTNAANLYYDFNNSGITSTQFSIQTGGTGSLNVSGDTYVAYLFAHNAGGFGADGSQNVVSCGNFTTSASDTTISLGWEPQFVIFKRTDGAWQRLPGSAKDIGIGADGSVWVIGTNPVDGGYGIYRWGGENFVGIDGGAVQISVNPWGRPWVVNDGDSIYEWR